MKTYTIYFIDGTKRIVIGPTLDQAMRDAGIGLERRQSMCFYAEGNCTEYEWSVTHKIWGIKGSSHKPRRKKTHRHDDRQPDMFVKLART